MPNGFATLLTDWSEKGLKGAAAATGGAAPPTPPKAATAAVLVPTKPKPHNN